MRFAQPSGITPFQYDEELVTKTLCHSDVYEKNAFKEIFVNVLDALVRHGLREYKGRKKKQSYTNFWFRAISLLWTQRHDLMFDRTNPSEIESQTQQKKPSSSHKSAVDDVQSGSPSRLATPTKQNFRHVANDARNDTIYAKERHIFADGEPRRIVDDENYRLLQSVFVQKS